MTENAHERDAILAENAHERDAILAENERLRTALLLALGMLAVHEPPDSRAVSEEFIAMACVAEGYAEVEGLIAAALARLQAGEPGEGTRGTARAPWVRSAYLGASATPADAEAVRRHRPGFPSAHMPLPGPFMPFN